MESQEPLTNLAIGPTYTADRADISASMVDMDVDMDIDLGPLDGEDEMQFSLEDPLIAPQGEDRAISTTASHSPLLMSPEEIAANKVHLRGLDDLSTENIKQYSLEHFGTQWERLEWIDDTSANLIYHTPDVASNALLHLTDQSVNIPMSISPLDLRPAQPIGCRPGSKLQIRIALITDRKRPRAHETSRFYLMHPEHDPRERKRGEDGRKDNRRDYRKRRYSDEEDRRRRKYDAEEGFDASMYDDSGPPKAPKGTLSSSHERTRRRSHSYRRSRNRSASPISRNSISPLRHRRRTPPFEVNNREKELFPQKNRQPEGKDLFSNKLAAVTRKKELFPHLTSGNNHRRTDAFDAADETADLFAGRMPVPFVDGASEDKRLSQRTSVFDRSPDSRAKRDDGIDRGRVLRGGQDRDKHNTTSASLLGISIKGTASQNGTVKDLFPGKFNSGKELFSEKLRGRGVPHKFGYGQSNPTYQLKAADGQKYVLRKKPPGQLLSKTAHQVDREYRIIRALANTGVPVPRTYCLCEDKDVIGTVFYVMEFLDGRIFDDASFPNVPPHDRREMWRDALRVLGKLHRVDPCSVGLTGFGKPSGFYNRQIRTLSAISTSQAQTVDIENKQPVGDIPHFDETVSFLKGSTFQPTDRGTIIHGDYKIDNLVYHHAEPKVIGILERGEAEEAKGLDLAYEKKLKQGTTAAGALAGKLKKVSSSRPDGELEGGLASVKLAAVSYDPQDGLVTDSPPLVATKVNLKPTPSPDCISSDYSTTPEPVSDRSKPRKRPRKAQASRGDAVLIGFMGGLNHPELANRAGEEVLPQSDSEISSQVMDGDAMSEVVAKSEEPVDSIEVPDMPNVGDDTHAGSAGNGRGRPELPRLQTEEQCPSARMSRHYSDAASQTLSEEEFERASSKSRPPRAATDGPTGLGINGIPSIDTPRLSRSPVRRYTVPTTLSSPGETLAAMQPSPQIDATKSPNLPQGLPSLHDSGLKPLLDGAPPKNSFRSQLVPAGANSVLSPPMSSKMSRFPSPSSRSSSTFSPQFPHGQPSPAYSNPSPRDTTNMSPPSRPNVQLPPFVPRHGSEALTPQSADSYTSSYKGAPSPLQSSEAIEMDRAGRVLPPLIPHPGPPIINGSFRCKHDGCNAQPFQTQYLLKFQEEK
ncbi:uncharacterized protein KY384_008312 [Bacidia gigantensis]|uniref:uncharacterized protein n=1 Tax=Bacidia gigantensis TaxID=2732470 RepID=UPI001D0549DA|nr:uncharacterized protein KY384_008312 [Bacidia gigantensis]KAG8526883.1 hypothetical protein KY384_008312 [Bacidia gigantensis]